MNLVSLLSRLSRKYVNSRSLTPIDRPYSDNLNEKIKKIIFELIDSS